jgi:hypothetical protein
MSTEPAIIVAPATLPIDAMRAELDAAEAKLHRSFAEVAATLTDIRRRELYRGAGYIDFFRYAKERLSLGRRQAYRLLSAHEVLEQLRLCPAGHNGGTLADLITGERQLRYIAAMPVERQAKVIETAARKAPVGAALTGPFIESVARHHFRWKSEREYRASKEKPAPKPDDAARINAARRSMLDACRVLAWMDATAGEIGELDAEERKLVERAKLYLQDVLE